jgi:hypothetical protein
MFLTIWNATLNAKPLVVVMANHHEEYTQNRCHQKSKKNHAAAFFSSRVF